MTLHYSRCIEAMQLLAAAFERLMHEEFFTEKGVEPYASELAILMNLNSAVEKKSITDRHRYMVQFADTLKTLVEDLNSFIKTRSDVNENFKFWAQFLDMMAIVRDLLRADHEGMWELHLDTVQRTLNLFAAFDSTNYTDGAVSGRRLLGMSSRYREHHRM